MASDTPIRGLHRMGIRIAFAVWVGVSLVPSSASACACCTDTGQRTVVTEKFDGYRRGEMARLRFASTATFFTGPADLDSLKGVRATAASYTLQARHTDAGVVFTFRGDDKSAGTLNLTWPDRISVFEVDPRTDKRHGGMGPRLYKEWSVSGTLVGTGIFAPGNGAGTSITLIVHGSGNRCGEASDFTAWTLVAAGPNAAYSLIGDLLPPR